MLFAGVKLGGLRKCRLAIFRILLGGLPVQTASTAGALCVGWSARASCSGGSILSSDITRGNALSAGNLSWRESSTGASRGASGHTTSTRAAP